MPDAQLAREILTLVIAGHETTASVLNWIWYLLAKHPDVQSRVAAEVRELKRRNKLLEQENEVLRRAAAYLSQTQLPGKGSTRS